MFGPATIQREPVEEQSRPEKRDRATRLTLSEIARRERLRGGLTQEEAQARSRLVAREIALRWRQANASLSKTLAGS
jgi:hypothetical protein